MNFGAILAAPFGNFLVTTHCTEGLVTLADLRARIWKKSGTENSTDLTKEVIDDFINDGIAELWDLLKAKDDDRLVTDGNLLVTAGNPTVALPCGFYELRKLEIVDPSTPSGQRKLMQGSLDAQHLYSRTSGKRYRYRLQGSSLVLMPTPQVDEVLTLYYIPIAPKLVEDDDRMTGYNGYERYVLAYGWRECLNRQDLDPAPADRELARLAVTISAAANGRDVEPFYLDPRGAHGCDDDWEVC